MALIQRVGGRRASRHETNVEGLTWDEWNAAVLFGAGVHKFDHFRTNRAWRKLWREGVDPTQGAYDFGKAVEAKLAPRAPGKPHTLDSFRGALIRELGPFESGHRFVRPMGQSIRWQTGRLYFGVKIQKELRVVRGEITFGTNTPDIIQKQLQMLDEDAPRRGMSADPAVLAAEIRRLRLLPDTVDFVTHNRLLGAFGRMRKHLPVYGRDPVEAKAAIQEAIRKVYATVGWTPRFKAGRNRSGLTGKHSFIVIVPNRRLDGADIHVEIEPTFKKPMWAGAGEKDRTWDWDLYRLTRALAGMDRYPGSMSSIEWGARAEKRKKLAAADWD